MFNLTQYHLVIFLAIIVLSLVFTRNSSEGMLGDIKLSCDVPFFNFRSNTKRLVPPVHLTTIGEDYSNTGLYYNHNTPYNQYFYDTHVENIIGTPKNLAGYYMANNCRFSKEGINYDQASKMIRGSKLTDLVNQHNHNIITSPHTHIGKNRGYLNWD